jgi:uncharacterized protein
VRHTSAGLGQVFALTVVYRPPTPDWQPYVPYGLALIDLDEGVRCMSHTDVDLGIGDRVALRIETRAGRPVPVATRDIP